MEQVASTTESDHLLLRGNSVASKAMEAYMKLVDGPYLQDTLGDFIKTLVEADDDCEIDGIKVKDGAKLDRNRKTLMFYVEIAWGKIQNSVHYFPNELRQVFCEIRDRLAANGRSDLVPNLLSANLFLRFLCPAILSPNLFGLASEYPNERSSRSLTLVAKTIQSLANFTEFDGKEEYMEFMNVFVKREWGNMRLLLDNCSSYSKNDMMSPFSKPHHGLPELDGYVDLGKELSSLHCFLCDVMHTMSQGSHYQQYLATHEGYFSFLSSVLARISESVSVHSLPQHPSLSTLPLCPSMPGSSRGHTDLDSCSVVSPMSDYDNADFEELPTTSSLSLVGSMVSSGDRSPGPRRSNPGRDAADGGSSRNLLLTPMQQCREKGSRHSVTQRAPSTTPKLPRSGLGRSQHSLLERPVESDRFLSPISATTGRGLSVDSNRQGLASSPVGKPTSSTLNMVRSFYQSARGFVTTPSKTEPSLLRRDKSPQPTTRNSQCQPQRNPVIAVNKSASEPTKNSNHVNNTCRQLSINLPKSQLNDSFVPNEASQHSVSQTQMKSKSSTNNAATFNFGATTSAAGSSPYHKYETISQTYYSTNLMQEKGFCDSVVQGSDRDFETAPIKTSFTKPHYPAPAVDLKTSDDYVAYNALDPVVFGGPNGLKSSLIGGELTPKRNLSQTQIEQKIKQSLHQQQQHHQQIIGQKHQQQQLYPHQSSKSLANTCDKTQAASATVSLKHPSDRVFSSRNPGNFATANDIWLKRASRAAALGLPHSFAHIPESQSNILPTGQSAVELNNSTYTQVDLKLVELMPSPDGEKSVCVPNCQQSGCTPNYPYSGSTSSCSSSSAQSSIDSAICEDTLEQKVTSAIAEKVASTAAVCSMCSSMQRSKSTRSPKAGSQLSLASSAGYHSLPFSSKTSSPVGIEDDNGVGCTCKGQESVSVKNANSHDEANAAGCSSTQRKGSFSINDDGQSMKPYQSINKSINVANYQENIYALNTTDDNNGISYSLKCSKGVNHSVCNDVLSDLHVGQLKSTAVSEPFEKSTSMDSSIRSLVPKQHLPIPDVLTDQRHNALNNAVKPCNHNQTSIPSNFKGSSKNNIRSNSINVIDLKINNANNDIFAMQQRQNEPILGAFELDSTKCARSNSVNSGIRRLLQRQNAIIIKPSKARNSKKYTDQHEGAVVPLESTFVAGNCLDNVHAKPAQIEANPVKIAPTYVLETSATNGSTKTSPNPEILQPVSVPSNYQRKSISTMDTSRAKSPPCDPRDSFVLASTDAASDHEMVVHGELERIRFVDDVDNGRDSTGYRVPWYEAELTENELHKTASHNDASEEMNTRYLREFESMKLELEEAKHRLREAESREKLWKEKFEEINQPSADPFECCNDPMSNGIPDLVVTTPSASTSDVPSLAQFQFQTASNTNNNADINANDKSNNSNSNSNASHNREDNSLSTRTNGVQKNVNCTSEEEYSSIELMNEQEAKPNLSNYGMKATNSKLQSWKGRFSRLTHRTDNNNGDKCNKYSTTCNKYLNQRHRSTTMPLRTQSCTDEALYSSRDAKQVGSGSKCPNVPENTNIIEESPGSRADIQGSVAGDGLKSARMYTSTHLVKDRSSMSCVADLSGKKAVSKGGYRQKSQPRRGSLATHDIRF